MPCLLSSVLLADFIKRVITEFESDVIKRAHITSDALQQIVSVRIAGELKEDIYVKIRSTLFPDVSSDIYGSSYLAVSTKLIEAKVSKLPIMRLVRTIPMGESSTGYATFEKFQQKTSFDNDIRRSFFGLLLTMLQV